VVRWRADEVGAGLGEPDLRDLSGHLLAHQLPALAGLGPLRHFDRQLVGVHQILGVDAEPAARDLADAAAEAALVDVSVQSVNGRVGFPLLLHLVPKRSVGALRDVVPPAGLAALAAVACRAQFVDRRGDRHVRRACESAVGHRGTTECVLDDTVGWFHVVNR